MSWNLKGLSKPVAGKLFSFLMNNLIDCALSTGYIGNYTEGTVSGKFLVLKIGNQRNCKNHIDQMISELSGVY
jgi:hypothetical protein